MSRNIFLDKNVSELELSSNLTEKLLNGKVFIVRDLWQKKRKDLKDMGLVDNEINQIMIKMQLHGLDLNRKVY